MPPAPRAAAPAGPAKKCTSCGASFSSRNDAHTTCRDCFDAARDSAPINNALCSKCRKNPIASKNPAHTECKACFDAARAAEVRAQGPKACTKCGKQVDSLNPKHVMCNACSPKRVSA